jgi:hypothetical protein
MRTAAGQILLLRSPLVPVPPGQDTDGDGMADNWESRYGLNPYDPMDAGLDLDGNGLTTLEEYWSGVGPYSGSNPLKFQQVSFKNNTLTVVFSSVHNRNHSIWFVPTLETTNWTVLTNGITGTGGFLTNEIAIEPIQSSGFLRLRAAP